MVVYRCNRCHKEFCKKSNHTRHINRKVPCKELNDYKCDICNKEFKRKYNYDRHIEKVCSSKSVLCCDYCNKIFKSKYYCNKHMKSICKLRKSDIVCNNTNNINNTNIVNINNNINNNININIYGFVKEDFSKLSDNFISRILNRGFKSVENLVKYTSCNKNTPEYHNLLITNRKENLIHVFDGNKWELANKKDTLEHLIGNRLDYLLDRYYELKSENKTTPAIDRKINLLQKAYDHNNEELFKRVKSQLELLLYNSKDVIKGTKCRYMI